MNINVNNVNLYYEMYGNGQPIILVHGNSETHEIFDVVIKKLKDMKALKILKMRFYPKLNMKSLVVMN